MPEHLNLTIERGKNIRLIQFIQWSQYPNRTPNSSCWITELDLVCGIRESTSQISVPIAQHNVDVVTTFIRYRDLVA
jgi:hypothetical protein